MSCRLSVVILIGAATGCTPDGSFAPTVERSDSAGVEIVDVSAEDRPLDWRFVERWRISGGTGEEDAGFSQLSGSQLGVDENGRLMILDPAGARILVADTTGRLLNEFGRSGDGPGEFLLPVNLSVLPDGSVSVYDFRKRALIRFASDGEFVGEERPDINYTGPHLLEDSVGLWFTQMTLGEDRSSLRRSLVRHTEDGSRRIASLTQPMAAPVQVPGCPVRVPGFPFFTPDLRWTRRNGSTAVSDGVPYRVDLYEDTILVRSIRRDLAPRRTTREMAVRQLGDGYTIHIRGQPCTAPAEAMAEARGWANELPVVGELMFGPGGELWVQRGHVEGEEAPIDVFTSDGSYLGTLPPGTPLPAAFLTDRHVVAVEKDEFDVPSVVAYEIQGDR